MQLAEQECPSIPIHHANWQIRVLRAKLIYEEFQEFLKATNVTQAPDTSLSDTKFFAHGTEIDPVETADALADLLYVVYGAAVAYGTNIDQVFGAVHNSNMEKFGPGSGKNVDGKWLKPPGWTPPDIKAILDAQGM